MSTLKNDRFLRALNREPVDATPIWVMRQAGRYLPEYRATRARAGGFMDLCRNAELACEVTLQPLERFDLDAAILFSDILTIPDAMGLDLEFQAGEGPVFHKPLRTEADVAALPKLDVNRDLDYVMNAVRTIRSALGGRVPLIGFSGSPWTLATYMIEGAGSKEYPFAKGMLYGQPDVMHALLDQLADTVADYLNAQILAGAQAVQIFDTWGGALPFAQYDEFSLRSMKRVVSQLIREHDGRKVPVILFTKGGGAWLEAMADADADALGLDWSCDLGEARARVGHKVALQGNLDPGTLFGSDEAVAREARRTLDKFGPNPGHVFNLGHGISQFANADRVKTLVDTVHDYSAELHAKGGN
ncbi:uroporphyrinogen decarboxylase [Litorivicinus lipolyticus]|uniref:Uroporphyrinogen decarboxylase n=1 Tax=Litorivicinus lipolyticus TaxID=418701 RepID=A0A5Q2Q8E4_9GAMM|nr:uroporphyrinogen decarboxylase [Litorivicinus lipolyticus]QGG79333.1 uroporphyrinogen decarboxylase [Litorivicinus lipolyticus]